MTNKLLEYKPTSAETYTGTQKATIGADLRTWGNDNSCVKISDNNTVLKFIDGVQSAESEQIINTNKNLNTIDFIETYRADNAYSNINEDRVRLGKNNLILGTVFCAYKDKINFSYYDKLTLTIQWLYIQDIVTARVFYSNVNNVVENVLITIPHSPSIQDLEIDLSNISGEYYLGVALYVANQGIVQINFKDFVMLSNLTLAYNSDKSLIYAIYKGGFKVLNESDLTTVNTYSIAGMTGTPTKLEIADSKLIFTTADNKLNSCNLDGTGLLQADLAGSFASKSNSVWGLEFIPQIARTLYYKFNDNQLDSSGNNIGLSLVGDQINYTTGVDDKAVRFQAGVNYLIASHDNRMNSSEILVLGFMYIYTHGTRAILDKLDPTTGYTGFTFGTGQYLANQNNLSFYSNDTGWRYDTTGLTTDTWIQVGVLVTSTATKFYVNGLTSTSFAGASISVNIKQIQINRDWEGNEAGQFALDELEYITDFTQFEDIASIDQYVLDRYNELKPS